MNYPGTIFNTLFVFLFALVISACEKDDEDVNSGDPSNLIINVLSIDHEAAAVSIQAIAQNTVQYQFFLGDNESPEEINESGFFDHVFGGDGTYDISVRAYGSSGRYIKASQSVNISTGGNEPPVPLNKGFLSPLEYDGYTLVWQDEFNGFAIDGSSWGFDIGDGCPGLCGWGNNELEYYRAENAWVGDSVLTIEARAESFGGRSYTSAKLISRGKVSWQYGRIDIRALLPKGKGLWPALWMMGNDFSSAGWPRCGEIDIMEMIGGNNQENTVYGTAHWDNSGEHASSGGSTITSGDDFSQAYHVFSIIWDESRIVWLMDNQAYYTLSITDPGMSEFHQGFWFILNVAVGGNWPGNPDATTVFPQQMKVDYIRVFQTD